MRGKFALDRNGEDCCTYRLGRFDTENQQQAPCQVCDCFMRPDPTSTLQMLPAAKETRLSRTVRNRQQQNTSQIADTVFKGRKMFALQEINPLRTLCDRHGVTDLFTYLKCNSQDLF